MAATSTINSFLYHFADATVKPTALTGGAKLMDIKSYPDMGGAPETIETTTLSDAFQTSVNGVQSVDNLDFTANYEKAVYRKLKTLEGKGDGQWFALVLGANEKGVPDGHDGIIVWSGALTAYFSSGDVNAVREMHAVISVGTAPELLADTVAGA